MSLRESFIGLGSNLGGPEARIACALDFLSVEGVRVERVSSLYETEPVDAPVQPWFVNAVARVSSSFSSRALLALCQAIETRLGRERVVFHGPRTIDLDLLLVGDTVEKSPDLTLPHPELHRRRFVLVPLAEIAPELRHPQLGLTIAELSDRCNDRSTVRYLGPPPR